MDAIRVTVQFDTTKPDENGALKTMELLGRKKSSFITSLVCAFLTEEGIDDIESVTRTELEAALVNHCRLINADVSIRKSPANTKKERAVPKEELSKSQPNVSIQQEETEDDEIDSSMMSMMDSFK